MKRITPIGLWKAIAFLTAASLFVSCDPIEPVLKPWVAILPAENITATAATLAVLLTPNADSTVVTFEYTISGTEAWQSKAVSEKFNGTKPIKVMLNITNLLQATYYSYRVIVRNAAGLITSEIVNFATLRYIPPVLVKAVASIRPAENVTINEARLAAVLIPNQDSTTVTFEYSTDKLNWQSRMLADKFSGKDSIRVSCDLSELPANTKFSYRVKVVNIAGEITSAVDSFTTYALKDYDGNLYHTITIGTQTWLKENLKTTHYLNGDPIPNLQDTTAWKATKKGAYVYYNNDPKLGEVYGCLYNWYVTNDPRGLISGYHVPDDYEWSTLSDFVGDKYSGLYLMEKGNSHWVHSVWDNNFLITDSYGFTALPNGEYGTSDVTWKYKFMNLGNVADFWCSDSFGEISEIAEINLSGSMLNIGIMILKEYGSGIRLVKN